ncbi:hypothetical protein F4553_006355 [Allocatelliglobosispora scoriae]|uniref:HTH arsR-type domain-containing protein n=1 Tax=Allocatelliglobosispora scoriae TaxID=643052 RepID=A0A841C230_9ACTN|nr:helix-turn-helix domain-containing protein [Allocatelliglobosispora scoriae]MBB5872921.1 hypothetical protein [Allocatelliglobosispora scoriae]
MTWRIHFTALDLARVRIGDSLGPLAETLFGLLQLSAPGRHPVAFARWHRRALTRITPQMYPLTSLVPPGMRAVDLWTLTGEQSTIEQGIAALRAMREESVLAELDYFASHSELPRAAWRLANPGGDERDLLARAAYVSYRALIEPHWTQVRACLGAERMARADVLFTGGVESLFTTLYPDRIRWRAPVLEIRMPSETDIELGGRGLVLVPSLFLGERLVLLNDLHDEQPPRLVFPADIGSMRGARLLADALPGSPAIEALMGSANASALGRIADGCTTGELARHLDVEPTVANRHLAMLRQAGLVVTRRQGSANWHLLTPLGLALLDAS